MIRILRDNSIVSVFIVIALLVACHYSIFVMPIPVSTANEGSFLSQFVQNLQQSTVSAFHTFLYLFVIFIQAIWLQFIFNSQKLFEKPNYMVAAVFVLLSGFFKEYCYVSASLLNIFLVLLLFHALVLLHQKNNVLHTIFNIGALGAISFLINQKNCLLFPLLFIALLVLRPFRVREWILLLLGIIVPLYLFAGICYITDNTNLTQRLWYIFSFNRLIAWWDVWMIIRYIVLCIAVVYGFYHWNTGYSRMLMHLRRNWYVLLCCLLILPIQPFVFGMGSVTDWWTIAPFVAALLSCGLQYAKFTWLPNLIFIALLLIAVLSNYQLITQS